MYWQFPFKTLESPLQSAEVCTPRLQKQRQAYRGPNSLVRLSGNRNEVVCPFLHKD